MSIVSEKIYIGINYSYNGQEFFNLILPAWQEKEAVADKTTISNLDVTKCPAAGVDCVQVQNSEKVRRDDPPTPRPMLALAAFLRTRVPSPLDLDPPPCRLGREGRQ